MLKLSKGTRSKRCNTNESKCINKSMCLYLAAAQVQVVACNTPLSHAHKPKAVEAYEGVLATTKQNKLICVVATLSTLCRQPKQPRRVWE